MNRSKSGGVFQPMRLDVDASIVGRNLRVVDDPAGIEPGAAFAAPPRAPPPSLLGGDPLPSVTVTPRPGFCVKTRNVGGQKVFVNVCKVSQIPPAPHMTEDGLKAIIASDDYGSDYRVPMSLGSPRSDKDKSGGACLVSDVAVNGAWFEDNVVDSIVFTTFLVSIAMEGLCEKYGDEVNLDRQNWTLLKNKKYMGDLQKHNIQQRAKGNKILEVSEREVSIEPKSGKKPLIAELSGNELTAVKTTKTSPSKKVAPSVNPTKNETTVTSEQNSPDFKIFKDPVESEKPDNLLIRVSLPGVRSVRELTLDLGSDRFVLEARKAGHSLDFFLPFALDQDKASAEFHREKAQLSVRVPVL